MPDRLSVFAGAGALVPYIVAAARRAGYKVQILALVPRPDLDGVKMVNADVANPLGILWALKTFRTSHIVMAGGIVLSDKAREGLSRFAGGGAGSHVSQGDGSLSGLGVALKKMTGAKLIGVHEIAPDLLTPEGHVAGPVLDDRLLGGARFALSQAREMGNLDLGQALVTTGRRIVSSEDISGTDGLLERVGVYRETGLTGDGDDPLILAKASKPNQSLFIDLPAIGPATVTNAARAGIAVIALEANRTLLIEREQLIEVADMAGVSIVGLTLADG